MKSFILATILLMAIVSGKPMKGSVREVDGTWEFVYGIHHDYPAFGFFDPLLNKTGWGILRVETNPAYSNEIQSYAAGFLEGYLTENDIYIYSVNTYDERKPDDVGILDENVEWEMKESAKGDKRYWNHRKYLDLQVDGIYDGYMLANRDKPERHLTKWQVQYPNYNCDVDDWKKIYNVTTHAKYPIDHQDHCSALIRMNDDRSDIFIGQNTWSHLHLMHRIYKVYDINLKEENGELIPGHLQIFSSYPAMISSMDDYYTVNDHMVVMETTIGNTNPDLYKYQNGKAVMQWARTVVANRLATSPKNWCDIYIRYNNGCYANEWMVLDYNYFVPGEGLKKDGFWMIEQLPGYYHMEDMTDVLNNKGFYPSFNVAYFPDIWELSGFRQKWEKWGDDYKYETSRRNLIFLRDAPKVQDLQGFREIMRSNDFRHDPLSKCEGYPGYCGSYAISARYDLNLKNGTYPRDNLGLKNHAGTDAKITSMKLLKQGVSSQIISGPPYKNVEAFDWEKFEFKDAPHWCMPRVWRFPWLQIDKTATFTVLGYE